MAAVLFFCVDERIPEILYCFHCEVKRWNAIQGQLLNIVKTLQSNWKIRPLTHSVILRMNKLKISTKHFSLSLPQSDVISTSWTWRARGRCSPPWCRTRLPTNSSARCHLADWCRRPSDQKRNPATSCPSPSAGPYCCSSTLAAGTTRRTSFLWVLHASSW